jgi:5,10-methylenetetrahydrofolate reductase
LECVKTEANCSAVALVGGPSKYNGLSVIEATEIAKQAPYRFCIGGITLAERHRDTGNEDEIVACKVEHGIQFFTSQVVYNTDNAISFLRDYDELCKRENRSPGRVIFTFAPFARQETADFLIWLGVELPMGTIKRVTSRDTPKARVDEAIEICRENLKRILDACERYGIDVPIGFNAECVSKRKEEIEGALDLFAVLKDELDFYMSKRRVDSRAKLYGR